MSLTEKRSKLLDSSKGDRWSADQTVCIWRQEKKSPDQHCLRHRSIYSTSSDSDNPRNHLWIIFLQLTVRYIAFVLQGLLQKDGASDILYKIVWIMITTFRVEIRIALFVVEQRLNRKWYLVYSTSWNWWQNLSKNDIWVELMNSVTSLTVVKP